MENPELANTSTKLDKKKKSKLYSDKHGGSSDQESFLHVDADVKPRRSFWKNLFRKQPKKSEVPEMVTDQKAGVLTTRLNAIFEEPKTPEEKEHVVEEIEDIKKTLKKINPIVDAPPSVLLSGINPATPEPVANERDETLLEYLSDGSTSSDASVASSHNPEVTGPQTRDSLDAFITKLTPAECGDPKDPKKVPEQCENSLGRDGYSFEYSEASDLSTTDDENRDNKVLTFDEKVEQKDADSNIVLRELNPGNDAQESTQEPQQQQQQEQLQEQLQEQQQQEQQEVEDVEIMGADREEVVTGNGIVLVLPTSKIPVAVSVSHDQQQPINSPQTKRFEEDILTTSGSTLTTKTEVPKQWAANDSESATGSVDSLLEEAELWNRKLNELSCTSTNKTVLPTAVDIQSLDETEAGYREYRLDDFFKMIFRQNTDEQLLNYSVAYDPVFANFNVQFRQPTSATAQLGETDNPFISDKQKVVRKRKMMSLLHDKTKMAEYLKEIEQQEEQQVFKQQQQQQQQPISLINNCNTPFNSPNKQESSTITQHTYQNTIAAGNNNKDNADDPKNIDDDQNVLFVLENTKQKLQKYLDRTNNPPSSDPKVHSLYPDNYLEIFNMAGANKPAATKSDENINTSQDLPTVTHKIKQFQNIGNEISTIFEELLTNIAELKDTCIMNGAEYDAQTEPLITMTPLIDTINSSRGCSEGVEVVQPLLENLLERVFHVVDTHNIPAGHFAPAAQSFIKEFGTIHDTPATLNISTTSPNTHSSQFLQSCISLQRSEGFLTALKDEVTEYCSTAAHATYLNIENDENEYINLSSKTNQPDFIPRHFLHLLNPTETSSQTDPLSTNGTVRETAENLLQNIEQSLERSKKFGPYYDKKPGESLDSTKFPQKQNELYKNFRSTDLPEMTDSLQHIFFGTETSGEIVQSEFNLIEENTPRPGTSKNINTSLPTGNNSLNTSLPHLPSVPSTDLYMTSEKDSLKMDSNLETLVENRFSGLTGTSSMQEDIPLDLVTFPPDASGSGISYQLQKENFQLERKCPETNLVQNFDLLNKKEIDKSIEDNLKTFQESIHKINKTNAKTVEMLSSSNFSTPEGSLSILSTITENILETASRASKTSDDRYPQFIARSETNAANLPNNKTP